MFGTGNVAVHAVTIGVDVRTPGIALQQLADTDPTIILPWNGAPGSSSTPPRPSMCARNRLPRCSTCGYDTSPEATRYVPSARALAVTLDREATGPLSYTAHQLAEDIGVAA